MGYPWVALTDVTNPPTGTKWQTVFTARRYAVACVRPSVRLSVRYKPALHQNGAHIINVYVCDLNCCFMLPTGVINRQLECGPMPNVMVVLPNVGGALCSTPQSLADAHY